MIRRYGPLLLVAAVVAAMVASGAWRLVSLETLQRHHAELRALVQTRWAESLAVFFLVCLTVAVACLPGPGLLCLAGGYLFGAPAGGATGLAAAVVGSMIVYAAARNAFAAAIARRSGPRLRALEAALRSDAFGYLLALKLMPFAPFPLANIAAGLAGVRPAALFWASALGGAPLAFIYAGLGASLSRALESGVPLDRRLLERPDVLWPVGGLVALSLAAFAWRLLRRSASLPAPPP